MDFLSKIKWIFYIVLGLLSFIFGYFMIYSIIKYSEAKRDGNIKPDILKYMSRTMLIFILLFLINISLLFFTIYTVKVTIPRSVDKVVKHIGEEIGKNSFALALKTIAQTTQK